MCYENICRTLIDFIGACCDISYHCLEIQVVCKQQMLHNCSNNNNYYHQYHKLSSTRYQYTSPHALHKELSPPTSLSSPCEHRQDCQGVYQWCSATVARDCHEHGDCTIMIHTLSSRCSHGDNRHVWIDTQLMKDVWNLYSDNE